MLRRSKPNQPPALSLGIAASECLAKTTSDGGPGIDVTSHCLTVGRVAKALIETLPPGLRYRMLSYSIPSVAALHDVGKVSPTFQEKIRRGTNGYIPNSHDALVNINPDHEQEWGGHAGASLSTLKTLGWPTWAQVVVGQHHGFTPYTTLQSTDSPLGGLSWHVERELMCNAIHQQLGFNFPPDKISDEDVLIASGITTVSDWIASAEPLSSMTAPTDTDIQAALRAAGFTGLPALKSLSFKQTFGFDPREEQECLIESISGPGVYILEAPMGVGKTEAALYAAYKMMQQGIAHGIYFALPTQITSNKIYERINDFLSSIAYENHQSSRLLHSNADLVLQAMGEDCDAGRSWFDSKKRGLLAPFAVGTIDQALMAAMNVKHGFVRAFGLSNKVVILDEVHSYDLYTSRLLVELVRLLREMKCVVILLSATLHKDLRQQLLGEECSADHYPLVISQQVGIGTSTEAIETDASNVVQLNTRVSESTCLMVAVERASMGQQVLWVENSVSEAQVLYNRFQDICKRRGIELGLLHSRFTPSDRNNIERKWLDLFGKNSGELRSKQGRILIGTQVLEQSIDIDADFLVTRLAPTDFILQRIGRLWRHSQPNRNSFASREAWIMIPNRGQLENIGTRAFGTSAFVYDPYVLLRSFDVFHELREVALPGDIRTLVNETYCERDESGEYLVAKSKLKVKAEKLNSKALSGVSKDGSVLQDETAQTRLSETPTSEVLLCSSVTIKDGRLLKLITVHGFELDLSKDWAKQKRSDINEAALKVKDSVVSVPEFVVAIDYSWEGTKALKRFIYIPESETLSARCVIGVVDGTGKVSPVCGLPTSYQCTYSDNLGFAYERHGR